MAFCESFLSRKVLVIRYIQLQATRCLHIMWNIPQCRMIPNSLIVKNLTHWHHLLLSLSHSQDYDRDRRLYQHQLDLEKAEQLKRPTEDLLVTDTLSFPLLKKLDWLKLPSHAFADLTMVLQFVHSFREFLEMECAPSFPSLFCSLYNHGTETLSDLFVQLLRAALFDPGSNALTTAGTLPHNYLTITS